MFAQGVLESTSCFDITMDSRIFHRMEDVRIHVPFEHNARKMVDSMDPSCMADACEVLDILAFAYMGHGCSKDKDILGGLAIHRIGDVVHNELPSCKPVEFTSHLSDKIGFYGQVGEYFHGMGVALGGMELGRPRNECFAESCSCSLVRVVCLDHTAVRCCRQCCLD